MEYITDIEYGETGWKRERERKSFITSLHFPFSFSIVWFNINSTSSKIHVWLRTQCIHIKWSPSLLSIERMFCVLCFESGFMFAIPLCCHLFDAMNWHRNIFAPAIRIHVVINFSFNAFKVHVHCEMFHCTHL